MNIEYCNDKCPIGKAARDYYLSINNSTFDAAFDFRTFTNNCYKNCACRDRHNEVATPVEV